MWYVSIIRSENFPEQEYVGATADLKRRLPEHNAGKSAHTAKFRPWKLVWFAPSRTNTKHSNSKNI
jgi:predicted GIY-YIG superfamily endonuclease